MSGELKYDLARYPTKDTVKMLTFVLEKAIKTNDAPENGHHDQQQRRKSLSFTCFYAKSVPSIPIHAYLTRILKYCPCANECFLAVLIYLERMSKTTPARAGLKIDSYNIHRLLIAGIMIASKLFSDVFFTNTRYAKVGGLPVSELNLLELEFLTLNDFSLYASVEELQHYGDQLLTRWTQEHKSLNNLSAQIALVTGVPDDEFILPVRRRARHLSIDRQNVEESVIDSYRVHKRPTCNSSSSSPPPSTNTATIPKE